MKMPPASCSGWNRMYVWAFNKRRVFWKVIEEGLCLGSHWSEWSCESSLNLLDVRVRRKSMRWTDNQGLHQTGMNWKTKCKLQQLQDRWKAEAKNVEIGTQNRARKKKMMNSKYRLTVSSASFTMCTPVAAILISIKVYFLHLTRVKTLAAALQEHWACH